MATKKAKKGSKKVVKKVDNTLKIGDLVTVVKQNSYFKIGDQAAIMRTNASNSELSSLRTHSEWTVGNTVFEKIDMTKVKYILQYLTESDPFEVYETLDALKSRISVLMNDDYYEVKGESFVVYDVSKVTKLSVKKTVDISGL